MYNYVHISKTTLLRETQLDHVCFVGIALLIGLFILLILEKYSCKVIHLFTQSFVDMQQLCTNLLLSPPKKKTTLLRETQLDRICLVGIATGCMGKVCVLIGLSIILKLEKYSCKAIHLFVYSFIGII